MLYPVRRFSIHYLLLLTIALLALSLGTPAMAAKKESKAKKPKLDSKTVKYEIQYLKKSIDKHAKIIQKLKDIDTLTTNVQVIAFVNIFIPAEEAEMVTMKAMLSNWYQIIYNPKPRLDDEDEEEAPDDIEIIGSMIGYANSEIAWAKQVEKKAGHPELKALAKAMITSSRAQVAELKSYLRLLETDDEPLGE